MNYSKYVFVIFLCLGNLFNIIYANAQSGSMAQFKRLVVMDGKVSYLAPVKFKSLNKKDLAKFEPGQQLAAVGQVFKNDTKILFYKTNVMWDYQDNGIKIWQMAALIARGLKDHKFLETGYFEHEGTSSTTYFMKVSFMDGNEIHFALLTFSVLDNHVLYGLFINKDGINVDWANTIETHHDGSSGQKRNLASSKKRNVKSSY